MSRKRFLLALTLGLTLGIGISAWCVRVAPVQAQTLPGMALPDQVVTGTLTDTTGTVTIALQGYRGCAGTIGATAYSGNVDFLLSFDGGVNYCRALILYQTGFGVSGGNNYRAADSVASTPSVGFQFLDVNGATHARVQMGTYASGSVVVTMKATACDQPSSNSYTWADNTAGSPQIARFAVIGGMGSSASGTAAGRALRVPDKFFTASVTASGNTALWTPTAGKKFRLMRYKVGVTSNSNLAAGAVLVVSMQDSATDINQTHSVFVPTTAVTTAAPPMYESGWIDLGNGVLSAAANNVLNVNLSAAVTTGAVRVTCCGTEE